MTLAELITALEAADPNRVVPHGFTNPHSYRGYYHELAFEPAANVTVSDMLEDARLALGSTYQGWKGGDFTMSEHTECWLSMEGCASGDTISALLLQLMLAEPPLADAEALPATTSPMSQPEPLTEQQLDEIDTLPAWLYQRFMAGGVGWENLDADDRTYWEHQARAVRRAVARGGFKTASEATSAPLAALQPSEAPVEGETATRASTGHVGDSGEVGIPQPVEDLADEDGAEVRRLRADLAAVVALHEKGEHNGLAICLHCAQQMFPPPDTGIWSESAYPCATLQALGVGDERPAVASAAGQSGRTL